GFHHRLRLDLAGYHRTFKQFADDDVFLNTGVTFPIAFDSASVSGLDAKLTLVPWHNWSGTLSYSLLKGTARLPVVGGLFLGGEDIVTAGEVPITQDQRHTMRLQGRYQINARIWAVGSVHYGSGLPVEFTGGQDLTTLVAQYGVDVLRRVDFEAGRVRPNL